MDCRGLQPRSDEGVAVSESFSSVSDTIFNLDIIHRTNMQGNVTARQQTEEKLQLYASVFRHAREGIMITDIEGTILDANESFTRITGYSREEAVGQNPRILKSDRQDKEFYVAMWRDLIQTGHWSNEIWNKRKSGEVYPQLLTISAAPDAQGIVRIRWHASVWCCLYL